MGSLYLLIPIALLLLGVAVGAFLWAVDHGQFEDLEGEGERILLDDVEGEGERILLDEDGQTRDRRDPQPDGRSDGS